MSFKFGVIVIGSLLWDENPERILWRKELDILNKKHIGLPIRYGRISSSRENTYTMVFSNEINDSKTLGKGYVIPYKNKIETEKDFKLQILKLAKAENIHIKRMSCSWGTVSILINPNIDTVRTNQIKDYWTKLVEFTKETKSTAQKEPTILQFGSKNENKCITNNWELTINLNKQFNKELEEFDFLIATSNSIKHKDNLEKYPTAKEIAKAIFDNNHYEYFLKNRKDFIQTFQDKRIMKILKKKYKVNLKKERKKLLPTATTTDLGIGLNGKMVLYLE